MMQILSNIKQLFAHYSLYIVALMGVSAFSGCVGCTGCAGKHSAAITADGGTADMNELYKPKFATGYNILAARGGSVVEVKNPWQGAKDVSYKFFLSRDGASAPDGFTGEVIDVPLKRVVCMSSSHVAFIDALGCTDVVKGVSGARYISNEEIVARFKAGEVSDVGYDSGLNYELIASLHPDVVFIYGVSGENSAVTGKLREMGVRVVYVGDYLENSPLGKAEWVVFMGEFLDRRGEAEALFEAVVEDYEGVAKLAAGVDSRPKVMLNSPWRDSWFVPGDGSYMVRLLTDAGADYACAGVDDDKSRPIGIETAYLSAVGSDYWLCPGAALTMSELTAENPRFKNIPAVRNGLVYNNNARRTPEGGSDFWESGAISPHLVLRDLIHMFHPSLLPDHKLYYFHKLN